MSAPEDIPEPPNDSEDSGTVPPPVVIHTPNSLKVVVGVVKMLRPHQWVKNTFVLAPIFFAKDIFQLPLLLTAVAAFTVFCFLAGAVYTLNDLVDVEADRAHPVKKNRPIAAKVVSESLAKVIGAVLIVVSLTGAFALNWMFGIAALSYLVNNVAYSFDPIKLKKIPYVDVSSIALGFVLRVYAGSLATGIPISVYLIACTALLALFLGFGKRRHELVQGERKKQEKKAAAVHSSEPAPSSKKISARDVLNHYSRRALSIAMSLTGFLTVAAYAAYSVDPETRARFGSDYLWVTTVFPVLGMGRFLWLVISDTKSESPTQKMLSDVPFILVLLTWVIVVVIIVYQVRPQVTGPLDHLSAALSSRWRRHFSQNAFVLFDSMSPILPASSLGRGGLFTNLHCKLTP